jgi:hypothetical protein
MSGLIVTDTEPNRQHHPHRHRAWQWQGLALTEIIAGILLLASCVVGVAAIYAQQQHSLRGGKLHTVAAELGNEIAEMIRNEHDPSASFETGVGRICDATKPAGKTAEIDNQVACWQDKVARELSNGSARITLDTSTVPAQYVVTISWTDPRTGTASYVRRINANKSSAK